jgi:hypothetical protein
MQRITFRLGKEGHILDLQIPLNAKREPMY